MKTTIRYGAPVMWVGPVGELCFGVVHQITTTEGPNGTRATYDVRDRSGEVRWIKTDDLQELTVTRSEIYDEDEMLIVKSARAWAIGESRNLRKLTRKDPESVQPQELDVPIAEAPTPAEPNTPATPTPSDMEF